MLHVRDQAPERQEHEQSIGEVARAYGVSLRTLRFYEDRGLLHPRRAGSSRFYSAQDCIRLQLVQTGKRLGLSLTEILGLITNRPGHQATAENSLVALLSRSEIAAKLARLEAQRDRLNEAIDELRLTLADESD